MSLRILLVEDEPGLLLTVSDLLASEGYRVETASDGVIGLAKATGGDFDLIVLDVMLPKKSGLDVCRELRRDGHEVGILMLTAKSQVADRVGGLKVGADDYLSKPFDPSELLARVEALMRRAKPRNPAATIQLGVITVNLEAGRVEKGGVRLSLTYKEMQLLRYLMTRPNRIVSRQELLENVWEYSKDASSRTVDVHVAWLRQKLEDHPEMPQYIHTVRGKGYCFSM